MWLFEMLKLHREEQRVAEILGSSVKNDVIDSVFNELLEKTDKSRCLDVGCGQDKDSRFTTVDIDENANPDIVCDIRTLFASSDFYRKQAILYDTSKLRQGYYKAIRLKHIVEHIEWIYMQTFFDWINSLLCEGGAVLIDTPNLEYICRMYVGNRDRQKKGLSSRFPAHEHPDFNVEQSIDMQRWINFKLYSGCSPGDYHHACVDRHLLCTMLEQRGFDNLLVVEGETLRVIAYKVSSNESLESLVDKALGGVTA